MRKGSGAAGTEKSRSSTQGPQEVKKQRSRDVLDQDAVWLGVLAQSPSQDSSHGQPQRMHDALLPSASVLSSADTRDEFLRLDAMDDVHDNHVSIGDDHDDYLVHYNPNDTALSASRQSRRLSTADDASQGWLLSDVTGPASTQSQSRHSESPVHKVSRKLRTPAFWKKKRQVVMNRLVAAAGKRVALQQNPSHPHHGHRPQYHQPKKRGQPIYVRPASGGTGGGFQIFV